MRVDQATSYIDLFSSAPPGPDVPVRKQDTVADKKDEGSGGLPVPAKKPEPPVVTDIPPTEHKIDDAGGEEGSLSDIRAGRDVRHLSPRQMIDLSQDLYAAGIIDWEEYSMLAFQAELQPDFGRTIGALTGEQPHPDRPRDYIADWAERLAFEERHNAANTAVTQRTRHVLSVLNQIQEPTNMLV